MNWHILNTPLFIKYILIGFTVEYLRTEYKILFITSGVWSVKRHTHCYHQGRHSGSSERNGCAGNWNACNDARTSFGLNMGNTCGVAGTIGGEDVLWLGIKTAAIFPLASWPGTIWNWVEPFITAGRGSVGLKMVGEAKREPVLEETIGMAGLSGCGSIWVLRRVPGRSLGLTGLHWSARWDSILARTCVSSPFSDIK